MTVLVARAPARVNLIGEHTDYQDGFCVPMAIDRGVATEFEPTRDGRIHLVSDALAGAVDVAADGSEEPRTVTPQWGRMVAAVAAVLAGHGRAPVGQRGRVRSTVPLGAGLSSSAAFAVSVTMALAHVGESALGPLEVARLAQAAEHAATGVPVGLLDQLASVSGVPGHALLLDCRTLRVEPVALPARTAVLVVHSGLPRTLEGSEYSRRRAACEAAAARLGLAALRDAQLDQVADDPIARHVVSENARALAFVAALRRNDVVGAGALMVESHRSLAEDFRVSTPELDVLVEELLTAGAFGARLTGAGFGGCCVALTPADGTDEISRVATGRYAQRTGMVPLAFGVHAVGGATVESPDRAPDQEHW